MLMFCDCSVGPSHRLGAVDRDAVRLGRRPYDTDVGRAQRDEETGETNGSLQLTID